MKSCVFLRSLSMLVNNNVVLRSKYILIRGLNKVIQCPFLFIIMRKVDCLGFLNGMHEGNLKAKSIIYGWYFIHWGDMCRQYISAKWRWQLLIKIVSMDKSLVSQVWCWHFGFFRSINFLCDGTIFVVWTVCEGLNGIDLHV